jgi:hypothetical protein
MVFLFNWFEFLTDKPNKNECYEKFYASFENIRILIQLSMCDIDYNIINKIITKRELGNSKDVANVSTII